MAACLGTLSTVVASAQVINGLQTVVSRRTKLTQSPAVVTVGMIKGGSAPNIVPESVDMAGTIRTYDPAVRAQVAHDVKLTSEKIAESAGATAKVSIVPAYDMTMNNEQLTEQMAPVLKRAAYGKVATTLWSVLRKISPSSQARYPASTSTGRDTRRAGPGQGSTESQPEILRR